MAISLTKTCSRCGVERERDEFRTDPRYRDDLFGWCRGCERDWHRVRRDANRELMRAQERARYRENPEPHRARGRLYYHAHREQQRESTRRWNERNPERLRALRQVGWMRRQARELAAAGIATADQLMARIAYYGGKCWLCGTAATEIDHVIPLSRGGTNWPANLRPACRSCNARKSARKGVMPQPCR